MEPEMYTDADVKKHLKELKYEYHPYYRYSDSYDQNMKLILNLKRIQKQNFLLFIAIVEWFLNERYTDKERENVNPLVLIIADIIRFQLEKEKPYTRSSNTEDQAFDMYASAKDSHTYIFKKGKNLTNSFKIKWGILNNLTPEIQGWDSRNERIKIPLYKEEVAEKIVELMQKEHYKLVLPGNKKRSEVLIGACIGCNKHASFVCGNCQSASYCGTNCQKKHWDTIHSFICDK